MHIQNLIATKKTDYEQEFYSVFQLWQHLALDLLTLLPHHFHVNLKLNLAILYKQNLDN